MTRLLWRAVDRLGSRPLSVGLMASLGLYLAILFAFGLAVPRTGVQGIASGWVFRLAYVLIAVNTAACVIRSLSTVWPRCRALKLGSGGAGREPMFAVAGETAKAELVRRLGRRLFRSIPSAGGWLAVRGRYSLFGTPVFHLGILVLALAVLVDAEAGFRGTVLLNEGQSFFGEAREYLGPVDPALAPQTSFKVSSITPRYFGRHLFFTELVAELEGPVGPDARRHESRLSSPAKVGEAKVTLTGFGYSIAFRLEDSSGAVREESVANLMIFPPGTRDSLALPGLPHRVFLELYPDFREGKGGKPDSASMEPVNPRLRVTVLRNRERVAEALLRLGEPVEFEGFRFVPERLVPQGQFRVVSGRSDLLILVGMALMVLGLGWRVLFPRTEVLISPDGGGWSVHVAGEASGPEAIVGWQRGLT